MTDRRLTDKLIAEVADAPPASADLVPPKLVHAAFVELRSRRAADLSDADREALTWLHLHVSLEPDANGLHTRAIALLDRLGGKS